MQETTIEYLFNFKDFEAAMYAINDRHGSYTTRIKKSIIYSTLLFLAVIILIQLSYYYPSKSFAIVIFIILFLMSLIYTAYLIYGLLRLKAAIKKLGRGFAKFKYHKTIVTENEIILETDIEKLIQKWQVVTDVLIDDEVIRFKNGISSYFFIARSMPEDQYNKLKEFMNNKTDSS